MNLYLDTEFNGFGGELISLALVGDDDSWYECLDCKNPTKWVNKNVIPNLEKIPISKSAFQESLGAFLRQFNNIAIIANWPEDFKHFCDCLIIDGDKCINTPPITMLLRRDLKANNYSKVEHNALSDAVALMERHKSLLPLIEFKTEINFL